MPNLFKTLFGLAGAVAVAFNPAAAGQLAAAQQVSAVVNTCPAKCSDGVHAFARAVANIPYDNLRGLQGDLVYLNQSTDLTLEDICNDNESDRSKLGWVKDRISYCYEMTTAWIAAFCTPSERDTCICMSISNGGQQVTTATIDCPDTCGDILSANTNGDTFDGGYGEWCRPEMLGKDISLGVDLVS